MFNFRKNFCEEKNNNVSKEVKLMKVEDYAPSFNIKSFDVSENQKPKEDNAKPRYCEHDGYIGIENIPGNPYYIRLKTGEVVKLKEFEESEEKKQSLTQSFSFRR
jgi:hypothetical protein